MPSVDLLFETFELYYKKARSCYEKGELSLAKRYYLSAAEQMLKLAKESKDELQKARYKRAKTILEFAENISVEQKKETEKDSDFSSDLNISDNKRVSPKEALDNLDALEGLSRVKSQVRDWVDQISVFRKREENGLSVPDFTYHMVFYGNPGTGKTTVARVMAQIYCALGIVSKGQLVEVDKSQLVAGYVGQTAIKTREVIKKAIGGVLFIDEAYSLTGGGDFGREAIDTLIKEMEDHRDDLVVIVAGYYEPMIKFIGTNQGLNSRFKNFIRFDDYNGRELYNIFLKLCEKNQYVIEDEVGKVLRRYFDYLYENRSEHFGNGRDVRNIFETIVTKQSKRVVAMKKPSVEDMMTICIKDLPERLLKDETVKDLSERLSKAETVKDAPVKDPEPEKTEEPAEDMFYESDYKFEWDDIPQVGFDDIAGLEEVKEIVNVKVLLPLKHPEIFDGYVRKSGGGLLLYGPPGTGKTMIAAAIAKEIKAKFCAIKPSDLLNQGVGNTEKAVRALFTQARRFPCAVIFFDEMDSISPKTTRSQYAKQLRSELLAQLQGIEEYKKDGKNLLFLIAATNKPWDMDSAFVRPGRFGIRVYVGLPDAKARAYMIEHRLEKIRKKGLVSISDDLDVGLIVEKTKGFNGSDITALSDRAEEISALRCIGSDRKDLRLSDFEQALEKVSSSVQGSDIEKLIEWKNNNG